MYLVYSVILVIINEASSIDFNNASSFEFKKTSSFDPDMTLRGTIQDSVLNFVELSAICNYSAKTHSVITEDRYNLTMFNIPGDKKSVLLVHGIFDCADGWILRGKTSLACTLVERGYDVWVMNARGNRYSRAHLDLDPENPEFWNYSVHQLGYYDLASSIDYVLKVIREPQLAVIGFSEGTSMSYVLASTRPEYNKKIKCFISLAPIAFLHNTVGQMRLWIILGEFLDKILPVYEMVGFDTAIKKLINFLCTNLILGYEICYGGVMSNLIGPNLAGIEPSFFELVLKHFPAGTSKKNLVHYSQIGMRKSFSNYDYGFAKNLITYGSAEPPVYNLGKVETDVYLVSCKNDRVSVLEDVMLLKNELPNVVEWKILCNGQCNHLDHLWAVDAYMYEYPYILEMLEKCFIKM